MWGTYKITWNKSMVGQLWGALGGLLKVAGTHTLSLVLIPNASRMWSLWIDFHWWHTSKSVTLKNTGLGTHVSYTSGTANSVQKQKPLPYIRQKKCLTTCWKIMDIPCVSWTCQQTQKRRSVWKNFLLVAKRCGPSMMIGSVARIVRLFLKLEIWHPTSVDATMTLQVLISTMEYVARVTRG